MSLLRGEQAMNIFNCNTLKRKNKIKESVTDRIIGAANIVLLAFLVVLIAFPLLNYFSLAFNDGNFNIDVVVFPAKFSWKAISYVVKGDQSSSFWTAFLNSVIITLAVTIGSNLVEALAAYPLSKSDCPFRGGIMMFFIITMLFSAGALPAYLWMNVLGLVNTKWSLILISISNVGNLLYFKTFFEGLPSTIEEAARIDGASELQMFFKIVIPMSLPVIGSCCFFSIVGTWNSYGAALMFIGSSYTSEHPLAYYIYLLVAGLSGNKDDPWVVMNLTNINAAAMFLSIIPILCIYPYVIRYIKSGLTIGSVKG